MDESQVEIKEEPVFEEIEIDPPFEIKDELDDEKTIKIEIFPEPKYEVVEEELVSYDLLEPNVYTIITDSNERISIMAAPQQLESTTKRTVDLRDIEPESIRTKEKKKQPTKKMVQCKICRAKFFSSHTLILHEKTHNENIAFSCDKCEEVFSSLSLLMEHQKKKRHFKATDTFQEKVKALNKRKYKCKSCGLIFYSEKTFRFHVKIHAGLMKYSCNVCDEMFSTLSDLSFHREKLGHGMKCQDCGTICATVQEMDQHSKMHTKWKFYKCTDCNFSTVIQRHLRQHRATSCPGIDKEAAVPILCSVCNTLFKDQDIYLKHGCPAVDIVKPEEPMIMDGTNIIFDNGTIVESHQIEPDELL